MNSDIFCIWNLCIDTLISLMNENCLLSFYQSFYLKKSRFLLKKQILCSDNNNKLCFISIYAQIITKNKYFSTRSRDNNNKLCLFIV